MANECKYCVDGICVNADSPLRADYCPVPDVDGVCIYERRMNMFDTCGDNRFEIIEKAKKAILDSTNISGSLDEMKVLDRFLYRCWQMGWLNKYEGADNG